MSFLKFNLHQVLLRNLERLGFQAPTPIQTKAIPVIMEGRDVLGIAKTGSGKTASFVLPILNYLQRIPAGKPNRQAKVLILAPTRELAVQVAGVCKDLAVNLPRKVKSMAVYGGVSINPQMKGLNGVEVLIATPGRLLDLISSNAVDMARVEKLVIDEADKMLNLGFEKEMQKIFNLLPSKRQNMLFSATLSDKLAGINKVLLSDPVVVEISAQQDEVELINLLGYFVNDDRKGPLLRHLIREKQMERVLVFTSSGYTADKVADKLRNAGFKASAVHGKKSQTARMEALDKFKSGKLQVLVATDLLSRGIDIIELPYVINYELPRSPKDFVHRVGRTGRAKSEGLAISFISEEARHHFKITLKKMKRTVDMIDSKSLDF